MSQAQNRLQVNQTNIYIFLKVFFMDNLNQTQEDIAIAVQSLKHELII